MFTHLRPAIALTLFFTLLTGLLYPLAVTGAAQAVLPFQASGSPVLRDGVLVGSHLIGQNWTGAGYFHGRPSATSNDASTSSGSNLGTSSKTLLGQVQDRAAALGGTGVPVDLVTTSGSGLDPDVSPAGALFQVARIAKARGLGEDKLRQLIAAHTTGRDLGILGEPRVNVLDLNLALDGLKP